MPAHPSDSAAGRAGAPVVSVVIAARDAARWLAETLDSAFAQTWPATEVILVDDGSTDQTGAIARRYEARGLRLLSQPPRGVTAARNAGLRAARGAFVQYLDADDLLAPDKIERQVTSLGDGSGRDLATGRWARFRLDAAKARFGASALWRDLAPEEYLSAVARTGYSIPIHAWLLPRSIVDAIGPWDESLILGEDHDYLARAVLAATRIRFVAGACCFYRTFHAHSASLRRDRAATDSLLRAIERVAERLAAPGAPAGHRPIAADYYRWLSFSLYPERPDLVRIAERRSRELGGSDVQPLMGRRAALLARLVGWKAVWRLRSWLWSRNIYVGRDDVVSD